MTIQTATRAFQFGVMKLDDPDPALDADAVRLLYAESFPAMRNAHVEEPTVEADGSLLYRISNPQPQTKG